MQHPPIWSPPRKQQPLVWSKQPFSCGTAPCSTPPYSNPLRSNPPTCSTTSLQAPWWATAFACALISAFACSRIMQQQVREVGVRACCKGKSNHRGREPTPEGGVGWGLPFMTRKCRAGRATQVRGAGHLVHPWPLWCVHTRDDGGLALIWCVRVGPALVR